MIRRNLAASMFWAATALMATSLWICSPALSADDSGPAPSGGFRGVFFHPNIEHRCFAGYPWPLFDPYDGQYRARIRTYWPMTTYCYCDPAPDGVYYLREIVQILGRENASRIISTDFKGPGHDQELEYSIISAGAHSGSDMLTWNFRKCTEYGFAGWWIYSYQDQEIFHQRTGIRELDGRWKADLVRAIKEQHQ